MFLFKRTVKQAELLKVMIFFTSALQEKDPYKYQFETSFKVGGWTYEESDVTDEKNPKNNEKLKMNQSG